MKQAKLLLYNSSISSDYFDEIQFGNDAMLPDSDNETLVITGEWTGGTLPQSSSELNYNTTEHSILKRYNKKGKIIIQSHADGLDAVNRIKFANAILLIYYEVGFNPITKKILVTKIDKKVISEGMNLFDITLYYTEIKTLKDFCFDYDKHTEYDKFVEFGSGEGYLKSHLNPIFDFEKREIDVVDNGIKKVGCVINNEVITARFYCHWNELPYKVRYSDSEETYYLKFGGYTYNSLSVPEYTIERIKGDTDIVRLDIKILWNSNKIT